jgi:hypothetical protein
MCQGQGLLRHPGGRWSGYDHYLVFPTRDSDQILADHVSPYDPNFQLPPSNPCKNLGAIAEDEHRLHSGIAFLEPFHHGWQKGLPCGQASPDGQGAGAEPAEILYCGLELLSQGEETPGIVKDHATSVRQGHAPRQTV